MKSKKNLPIDMLKATTFELLERELIVFVLARTNTLGEAAWYLKMNRSTLGSKRKTYDIPTPVRNSYGGPKLTHKEMYDAFRASVTAPVQSAAAVQPVVPSLNMTFVPPPDSSSNIPPAPHG